MRTVLKNKMRIFLFSMAVIVVSCTDPIDVDLPDAEPLLVVDAWINNLPQEQAIKLALSNPYFDNSGSPAVNGASVIVTNNSNEQFVFEEVGITGRYVWSDTAGGVFGSIGDSYTLDIITDEGSYTAYSEMNDVPIIDSITYEEYEPAFVTDIEEPGWLAQFHATDLLGSGDSYWIKAFKNGRFLNKPQEINLAFDAAFDRGSIVDGIPFIAPIRYGINRVADAEDVSDDTDKKAPYVSGDTVKVEIHAITNEAFDFMREVETQLTLGDATIFAQPLTNVSTNIELISGDLKVVGFFNVASVSSFEEIVP